jgi:hypothetical protein
MDNCEERMRQGLDSIWYQCAVRTDVLIINTCRERHVVVIVINELGTPQLGSQCSIKDIYGPPGPSSHLSFNNWPRSCIEIEAQVLSDSN